MTYRATFYLIATTSIFANFGLSGSLASSDPRSVSFVGSLVIERSRILSMSPLLSTSKAPRIVRCLRDVINAVRGGLVTKGNNTMSFAPIDLS